VAFPVAPFALRMVPVLQREETLLQALENSELQYRRLFDTARDGILVVDAGTGIVTDANPFLLEMLGYGRDEVLGRRLWKIGFFKDRALSESTFASLHIEGYVRHESVALVAKDGRTVDVEFVGSLYEADQQRVIQCNIRDVTERRRLEARLQQVEKMEAVCQLAGGMAHDYNNILTSTLLRLNMLLEAADVSEANRGLLQQLESDARRAMRITRQLLLFSRQSEIGFRRLDLSAMLAKLLESLRVSLRPDVRLLCTAGDGPLWIEADAAMMEQLAGNLCLNAQAALGPGEGRLTLDARLVVLEADAARANPEAGSGPFVRLSVTDAGCGMTPAVLERYFEPFFSAKGEKDAALGLSAAYGIAKQHRGWMEVATRLGRFCSYRVHVPALAHPQIAEPDGGKPEAVKGKETILVVDDEQAVRKMVALGLQLYGYNVLEADSGPEAVQMWEHHSGEIDLLFTDMRMPGRMTGLDLFDELRRREPTLMGIVSSGYSEELVRSQDHVPHGLVFLPKPYDVKTLVLTVRACLEANGARLAGQAG
jgi:two-component system cell cycle sensor histidine kinase/response regulator CckA